MQLKTFQKYARKVRVEGLSPVDPSTGFTLRLPPKFTITAPALGQSDSFVLAPGEKTERYGEVKTVKHPATRLLDVDVEGIKFSIIVHKYKGELRLSTSDNVTGMAMPTLCASEKGNPVNALLVGVLHFIHAKGLTLEKFEQVRTNAYNRYKKTIESQS
ncbi:MAG: hypothetical protein WCZ86_06195 [Desulfurivibrionaceae bacterium]